MAYTLFIQLSPLFHVHFLFYFSVILVFPFIFMLCHTYLCFPGGSGVNIPPANAGDAGAIPGLGRSPREGNGNQLQYSCLGSPMDRGA